MPLSARRLLKVDAKINSSSKGNHHDVANTRVRGSEDGRRDQLLPGRFRRRPRQRHL